MATTPEIAAAAPVVELKDGAEAPIPAEEPAPEQTSGLPEALVRLPAMQGLLSGAPPAVSGTIEAFASRPEGKLIASNKDALAKAGFGLYRSLAGDLGVVFNRFFITDQEILDADKAGQISKIAPPFDEVNMQISSSGQNNPALNPNLKTPEGFRTAQPSIPAAMPAPAAPMAPPATQRTIGMKARNSLPGSPTTGPKPGAGRLMNQILKPVV